MKSIDKIYNYISIFFIVIFFILISYNLHIETPLWSDENLAIELSKNKLFSQFFKEVYSDVHPPLYHLILKLSFATFGENVFAARFPSYLFTFLTCSLLIKKFKNNSQYKFIFFSLFLSTWSVIYYSQEVRPYTLIFFISTLVYFNFYERILLKKENFKIFCILTILSTLIHYICFFFILGFYLAEVIYKKDFKFIFRKKYIFLFLICFLFIFLHLLYFYLSKENRAVGMSLSFFDSYNVYNFDINSKGFYYNNLHLLNKFLQFIKVNYVFISFLLISNFITLYFSKKNNLEMIYFNNLFYFTGLIIVLLLNVPMINHYVYIFLLLPFLIFLTEILIFIIKRNAINQIFIIILISFYFLLNSFWNFSKMIDHWSGSTTHNGYLNILAIKKICENSDCLLINNKDFDIYGIEKKISKSINFKKIQKSEIKKYINTNSQFLILFQENEKILEKNNNYNCFVLNNSFLKKVVIFLKKDLSPNYLKNDFHNSISVSISEYHRNHKCFN